MAHRWVATSNRIRRFHTKFRKFSKSGCREEREKKTPLHMIFQFQTMTVIIIMNKP